MKKAFTLPEAIICVGIIAVVAAIMLPGFFKVKPDDEKLMVKKAYNATAEIISYLSNDVSVFSRMQADGFADAQIYKDLDDIEYQGNTKFCRLFVSKLNTLQNFNEIGITGSGLYECKTNQFETIDGILWEIETQPSADVSFLIHSRTDQANYAVVRFKPPKPDNAKWREMLVSRYGRITIDDTNPNGSEFVEMLSDVSISK